MNGTSINQETNDSWWKDSDHIVTNSLVLDGKLLNDGNIKITLKEWIDLIPPSDNSDNIDKLLYKKLNKIYESIKDSGELGKLSNTTLLDDKTENEALGELLVFLDQIYSNGVVNTVGNRSKELKGNILGNKKNGNKFDIQAVEVPKTSGTVSYNLEYERTNGFIYTGGVDLEFSKDNRNFEIKIGAGYKF